MKKICFIAQFPPPMHGLSKAVETLYNSNLNFEIDSQGEFEFEKVDITNNKNFSNIDFSCRNYRFFRFGTNRCIREYSGKNRLCGHYIRSSFYHSAISSQESAFG